MENVVTVVVSVLVVVLYMVDERRRVEFVYSGTVYDDL